MKTSVASHTAMAAAAVRALESILPPEKRLFQDQYAPGFLKPWHRGLLGLCEANSWFRDAVERFLDYRFPGVPVDFICRTRYIDKLFQDELKEAAIQRVVTVGAGYDARPFRLAGNAANFQIVEIDHPATQARKVLLAKKFFAEELLKRTMWISHDLTEPPETSAELRAAFGKAARTFWVAEGLLGFLKPEAVQRLIHWIGAGSSPGSRLLFTYEERGFVEREAKDSASRKIRSYVDKISEPFLSGWTPVEMADICRRAGFHIEEDVSEAELARRYLAPLGRTLDSREQFRLVSAVSRA